MILRAGRAASEGYLSLFPIHNHGLHTPHLRSCSSQPVLPDFKKWQLLVTLLYYSRWCEEVPVFGDNRTIKSYLTCSPSFWLLCGPREPVTALGREGFQGALGEEVTLTPGSHLNFNVCLLQISSWQNPQESRSQKGKKILPFIFLYERCEFKAKKSNKIN